MAQPRPRGSFARAKLEIASIPPGQRFLRLYLKLAAHHALGFGKKPSRFSDPRKRITRNRFGVLYLGTSLTVCFLEALLRDKRNGAVGDFPLAESELHARQYAEIINTQELRLVDLRGNRAIRMGVPSDVARASTQTLSRLWSAAFYQHPEKPDGIIYPSRLNAETNLAIYDRAVRKLVVDVEMPLIAAKGLVSILNDLKIALVV